jgi:hypothetical protein
VLTVTVPELISSWDLLDHPCTPKTSWSITKKLALELAEHLELTRPKRILETGSGFSTAILGAYAAKYGAAVVTLEHLRQYERHTRRGLEQLGLAGSVDLRCAPLSKRSLAGGRDYVWYNLELDGSFDFVFVDGPPKAHGRWGVFLEIADHLRPGWEIWMDDGKRAHERKCVKLWKKHRSFSCDRHDIDGKGVYILRDGSCQNNDQDERWSRKVGVGILANGDRTWWERTQKLVDPGILGKSHIAAATDASSPREVPFAVNRHINRSGGAIKRLARRTIRALPSRPSGPPSNRLIGRLLHLAAQPSRVEYVLYLNDDWVSQTLDGDWLPRSLEYLEANDEVDQILLRHRIGPRATGTVAAPHGMGFIQLGARRCRDEPSLIRARRRAGRGLRGLLRRRRSWSPMTTVLRLPPKLETVQLSPGVFVWNGDHGRRH